MATIRQITFNDESSILSSCRFAIRSPSLDSTGDQLQDVNGSLPNIRSPQGQSNNRNQVPLGTLFNPESYNSVFYSFESIPDKQKRIKKTVSDFVFARKQSHQVSPSTNYPKKYLLELFLQAKAQYPSLKKYFPSADRKRLMQKMKSKSRTRYKKSLKALSKFLMPHPRSCLSSQDCLMNKISLSSLLVRKQISDFNERRCRKIYNLRLRSQKLLIRNSCPN